MCEKNPDHAEQRKELRAPPWENVGDVFTVPCMLPPHPHAGNWNACSPWQPVTLGSCRVLRKHAHPLERQDLFPLRIITSSSAYAKIFHVAVLGKNRELVLH